jgi:YfiH family protein
MRSPACPHGFFGREGGVSSGAMASLNCGWGSGDDLSLITENRRRAADALVPGASHRLAASDPLGRVVVAGEWPDDDRPHADSVVTDEPGLLLGILTADCAPVLLADKQAGVIAAAHAGWKGALAGVTDTTLVAMEKLGADRNRIAAAIGPLHRARASYEVDHAFAQRFLDADPENDRFFAEGPRGKPHFDLESYVLHRLAAAGLTRIEALGADTYAADTRYYSYRRSTHRSEPSYGRQISLIGLPA